jgi:hypothetical protein
MKNKFAATLIQNAILVGFTTGLSTIHLLLNPPIAALAKQPFVAQETGKNLRQLCNNAPSSDILARTELLFGLDKSDGSKITESEFNRFLNREVTPHFPDGLTLLSGRGQFRNSKGLIVKESSKLLILLYPIVQPSDSSQKIEQIRKAYKIAFQQESVLRTDDSSCVSF